MSERSGGRSSLFLMELMLAILIFSLCAAVCMKMFARARTDTDYSENLTRAVTLGQSACELYKQTLDPSAVLAALDGDGLELSVTPLPADGLYRPALIRVSLGGETLFEATAGGVGQ